MCQMCLFGRVNFKFSVKNSSYNKLSNTYVFYGRKRGQRDDFLLLQAKLLWLVIYDIVLTRGCWRLSNSLWHTEIEIYMYIFITLLNEFPMY